jgi:tetratricopeptide (TPR) repeat protein
MKLVLTILIFALLLISCRQKSFQEKIDDIRNDFSKKAEVYNAEVLSWENKIDSIIKLADTNHLLAIHAIDSIIQYDTIFGSIKNSELHFLKGDFYYQIDSFTKAIDEFSLAELENFASPKILAAKAGAHIKLREYDLASNELRQAANINYDYYWNIGNYFEIRGQRDSALSNYQKLYDKNKTVYKYCGDRIKELKNSKSRLLTELIYRDRKKVVMLMHGVK